MASAAAAAAAEWEAAARKVLVARKPAFGLPTGCPNCLPALLYLRMAEVPFDIHVDTSFPDAGEPLLPFLPCSSRIFELYKLRSLCPRASLLGRRRSGFSRGGLMLNLLMC